MRAVEHVGLFYDTSLSPLAEDDGPARARGYANVGVLRLSRPVDLAAHYGDL